MRRHPIESRRKKYAPVQSVADDGGYMDKANFYRKYDLKQKSGAERRIRKAVNFNKSQAVGAALRRRTPL